MIGIEKVNQLCRLTIILTIILMVFPVIISVVISVIIFVIFTRAKAAEELARAQKAAEEGMRKASLSLQVKIMRQIYEECHHVTLWGTAHLLEYSWMLWSLLFWIRYSIELFKFRDWIKMATTPLWVQALHWELLNKRYCRRKVFWNHLKNTEGKDHHGRTLAPKRLLQVARYK